LPTGIKHLITCRCVMPQYRRAPDPPAHQFVVFSIVDDDGTTRPRIVQCNNCGVVHKVVDVCRSEIVNGRDAMASSTSIDEVKLGMPPPLVALLESNDVDLSTWEMVRFVLEQRQWGTFVVLSTEEVGGLRQGKYLHILGEGMYKVETFAREEVVGR